MAFLREGERLGSYEIIAKIGGGGMGEVYRAVKLGAHGFRREVAVKIMAGHRTDDPMFFNMFHAEARIAAQLHHANIVSVLDFGVRDEDAIPWLAQEYVEGPDLARLSRAAPMPLPLALYVTVQLLRALRYAHEAQGDEGTLLRIVHRDVKPSNILVGRDGSVKLTDFGIAKITANHTGSFTSPKGSPGYIAPECCLDFEPPTPRSDLFAVGLVLYEMLTGRPLFVPQDSPESRLRLQQGYVPSLAHEGVAAPPVIQELLGWLLARDPARRCASAEDALRAILAIPEARLAQAPDLEAYLKALQIINTPTVVPRPSAPRAPALASVPTPAPLPVVGATLTAPPEESHRLATGRRIGLFVGGALALAAAVGVGALVARKGGGKPAAEPPPPPAVAAPVVTAPPPVPVPVPAAVPRPVADAAPAPRPVDAGVPPEPAASAPVTVAKPARPPKREPARNPAARPPMTPPAEVEPARPGVKIKIPEDEP